MKPRAYKNTAATETVNINSVSKPVNGLGEYVEAPKGTLYGGATGRKVERISKTTPIMETALYKWLEAEKNEGRVYTDMHFAIRRYLDGRSVRSKTQQERHEQVYMFFNWVIKTTLG